MGAGMTVEQWYVRRGRIARRVFWLQYMLPIMAAAFVAALIDATLGLWLIEPSVTQSGIGALSLAVTLATLVPSISSYVTRLHDLGHSAWWMLWGLIPFFGAIMLFIQTGFLRGDSDSNQYGPPTDQPVWDPVSV
jgi:uncharacterized membrane protein YhaH (DUF805 family)